MGVKVKILKNVGAYIIGQEVELKEEEAKLLCTPRKRHNGIELIEEAQAVTIAELEARKKMPVDLGGLTLDEARELGVKNVADAPAETLEAIAYPTKGKKKAS